MRAAKAIAAISLGLSALYLVELLVFYRNDYLAFPWEASPTAVLRGMPFLPLVALAAAVVALCVWKANSHGRAKSRTPIWALAWSVLAVLSLAPCGFVFSHQGAVHTQMSAVASVRTLSVALREYAKAHPSEGYPSSISQLTQPTDAPWQIDPVLGAGIKSAYRFAYAANSGAVGKRTRYTISAEPLHPKSPYSNRFFFTDESGVIRMEKDKKATADSAALQ
ncbi:hypothetical protein [Candidatus Korobacter versatilis]|uniref:hypothetical protein n=1 Tax=Candidatus Korobacter versatilis TaxID=658062 RepID=UPI00030CA948|nr:hypothetical protein [Candidatus Koribacter versatilis]